MVEIIIVSNIVLWGTVLVLALVIFALTRQVGILHERLGPVGAAIPINGPKVGESTSELPLIALDGRPVSIGGAHHAGLATLILFISPNCPICNSLVAVARSLANSERRRMRLVFASEGGNVEKHQAYARDLSLGGYPYVVSQQLGLNYQVTKLPFALLIGADGTLRNKGLVNTQEQLESLLDVITVSVATIQEIVDNTGSEYDSAPLKQSS